MHAPEDLAFQLPRLRASFGLENDTKYLSTDDSVAEFFDVKFCPFQPLDADPVFAAISKKHVVLCRLNQNSGENNPCQVIKIFRDGDEGSSLCCCTWAKEPVSGNPLICVGGVDAKIKIYNVTDGTLFNTLVGHGGDVNDLATSPIDPRIIVSASDDTSIRLWSLYPTHKEQPCLCIFAGNGHSWSLLSVAFHRTGRFLLSAGHDQVINLWSIPTLPTSPTQVPLQVHYPHFSTSAIHGGIVDCVAFYGDYILSRACHDNVIVLWRIEGFSSDDPVEETPPPTSYEDPASFTRSAFITSKTADCPSQYTRLLEFHTPKCGPQFFMRFSLFHVPDHNPVLAFCTASGNVLFWDFKRLEVYADFMADLESPERDLSKPVHLPTWLKPVIPRRRADPTGKIRLKTSERDAVVLEHMEKGIYSAETLEAWTARYSIEDPHEPLKAHRSEASSTSVVGRQASWSPGGDWCIVVGSSNTILIFQRWSKKTAADDE